MIDPRVLRVSVQAIRASVKTLYASTEPARDMANAGQERRSALETLSSVANELEIAGAAE